AATRILSAILWQMKLLPAIKWWPCRVAIEMSGLRAVEMSAFLLGIQSPFCVRAVGFTDEEGDRIEMNRRERDRLKVLYGVLRGEGPQKEAARLLRLTTRQVRRLVSRIEV